MPRKRFSVEQIIHHLREADVLLAQGQTVGEVCRLKELEQENARLKRVVADLTLDKLILQEAAEGNF